MKPLAFTLPLLVLAAAVASGCQGRSEEVIVPHPLTEAYGLMDQGQNDKAIVLLERTVQEQPDHSEAKVLLASAYAGRAGVDIYQLHRSFQDILFSKPLSAQLGFGSEMPTQEAPAISAVELEQPDAQQELLESAVADLDGFFGHLRNGLSYLNRFPKIDREKWPLLDESLGLLHSVEESKDVLLYRAFIRLFYLKAYVGAELLATPNFGKRQWACNIDFGSFADQLRWIARTLLYVSDDLNRVFPERASTFNNLHASVAALLKTLDSTRSKVRSNSATADQSASDSLRKAFNCK